MLEGNRVIVVPSRKCKASSESTRNIMPNSAKRKIKDRFPLIIDLEYFWIIEEVVVYPSKFILRESFEEFVSFFNFYFDSMAKFISPKAYDGSNRFYMKHLTNHKGFTYVYEFFFKELNVLFSLSPFENKMLNAISVTPNQLHPNNWAFLKNLSNIFPLPSYKFDCDDYLTASAPCC